METQTESAQRMYDARATSYDDSWHPDYSMRFVELVDLRPGQRILDLCCGTGLEAFLAADIIGDKGEVVGVDITKSMLAQAIEKQKKDPKLGSRMKFLRHDVADLESLPEISKGSFDVIMCSNAFVLLDDPAKVVAIWKDYLKPGGILAVDITHENNLRSGVVMERVAKRMGVSWPANRAWIKSRDSFKGVLENAGYLVEEVVELDKVMGQRATYYSIDQADEQYDYIIHTALSNKAVTDDFEKRARPVFKEEFAKDAVDGKVEIVDALYVYIAKKPE